MNDGGVLMKKGGLIIIAISCFMLGMSYSLHVEDLKIQSTAQASTFLNEQIEQYEASLKDEENTFMPYSQTVQTSQMNSSKPITQTSSQPSPTTSALNKVSGVSHNNISKLGQDIADVLKTIVREVLRTVVRFFDQLISE